jgi:glycosyltransferase EpsD
MKLLLAGKGALLEKCRELVCKLHREDQIRFLGYVSDIQELYAACDTCVSTSHSEGLPFNILEAMACGLPVIASDIKGHRELVSDGGAGVLYKNGNSADLQEKIKLMYEGQDFLAGKEEKVGTELEAYGLKRVLKQIMQIYEEKI